MPKIHQPYNNGLAKLFEDPRNFAEFLAEFVEWSKNLNIRPEKLIKHDPNWIADEGTKTTSDIVYRYQEQGKDIFIVITEPQATLDQTMAFRAADYRHSVLRQIFLNADENERRRIGFTFPAVEVVVLYHGKPQWSAPLSINAMQKVAITQQSLDPDYTLIDLNRMDIRKMLEKRSLVSSALSLFPAIHQEMFPIILREILQETLPQWGKQQQEDLLVFTNIAFGHYLNVEELRMMSEYSMRHNLLTDRERFIGDPFPERTRQLQKEMEEFAAKFAQEAAKEAAKDAAKEALDKTLKSFRDLYVAGKLNRLDAEGILKDYLPREQVTPTLLTWDREMKAQKTKDPVI